MEALPFVECSGSPREMGRQYGEQAREPIQSNIQMWVGSRFRLSESFLGNVRDVCRRYVPEVLEELGHDAPDVEEEPLGVLQDVRLVRERHLPPVVGERVLERVSQDALDPVTGVERLLGGDLGRRALVEDPTGAGVHALGVLPDDHEVAPLRGQAGEAAAHLRFQDSLGLVGLALGKGLAHADDGLEGGGVGGMGARKAADLDARALARGRGFLPRLLGLKGRTRRHKAGLGGDLA